MNLTAAREVLASLRSQPVASWVTALVLVTAMVTVVVTAGRNAATESQVLSELDEAGTRSLTVRAKGAPAGFDSSLVALLASYDVVAEVTGLGAPGDVQNAVTSGGERVALLDVYGSLGGVPLRTLPTVGGINQVWATRGAHESLGIIAQSGSVAEPQGREYLVTRTIDVPTYLAGLGSILVRPHPAEPPEPISSLVVVADSPENLELVQALVASALNEVPRDALTIESSQRLAELRAVIGGALTGQSRAIVLGVLAGAAGSVLMTIWSLVLLRRKDFGRRRALGATRTFILGLIVSQVGILATAGSVLGGVVGVAALAIGRHPVPPMTYLLALCIALTVSATAAAALPAAWASRREPLLELRVP